jgi:hypothetical protein
MQEWGEPELRILLHTNVDSGLARIGFGCEQVSFKAGLQGEEFRRNFQNVGQDQIGIFGVSCRSFEGFPLDSKRNFSKFLPSSVLLSAYLLLNRAVKLGSLGGGNCSCGQSGHDKQCVDRDVNFNPTCSCMPQTLITLLGRLNSDRDVSQTGSTVPRTLGMAGKKP